MEHLLLPAGAELTPDELVHVPYIAFKDYQNVAFLKYPLIANLGYAIPYDTPPATSQKSTGSLRLPEFERFIQTWLFFSLLQEVLGVSYFAHETFICCIQGNMQGEKHQVLTTSELFTSLEAPSTEKTNLLRSESALRCTKEALESHLQHLSFCLLVTRNTLSDLRGDFSALLKLVISVTAEALMGAIQFVAWTTETKVDYISFSDFSNASARADAELKLNRMTQNGWCKYQARCVLDQYKTYQARHFFSYMKKPSSGDSHQLCTDTQCVAGQINPLKSTPKHVCTPPFCKNFIVDEKQLQGILARGSLPLLEFKKDHSTDSWLISMVESTS